MALAQNVPAVEEKPIEVYIKGKKYASVEDYKFEKIRIVLEGLLEEEQINPDGALAQKVLQELREQGSDAITAEDINQAMARLKNEHESQLSGRSQENVETRAMREMLEQLKQENPDAKDIQFNPAAIKTIIVNPSGSNKSKSEKFNP